MKIQEDQERQSLLELREGARRAPVSRLSRLPVAEAMMTEPCIDWSAQSTRMERLVHEQASKGMHLWRIANNQIVEHWCNNDDLGVMRQFGVVS